MKFTSGHHPSLITLRTEIFFRNKNDLLDERSLFIVTAMEISWQIRQLIEKPCCYFFFRVCQSYSSKTICGLTAVVAYMSHSFQNMSVHSSAFMDSIPLSDDLCIDVKRYIKPLLTRNKSTAETKMFFPVITWYFNNCKIH
jgi:hypothetical protein